MDQLNLLATALRISFTGVFFPSTVAFTPWSPEGTRMNSLARNSELP